MSHCKVIDERREEFVANFIIYHIWAFFVSQSKSFFSMIDLTFIYI